MRRSRQSSPEYSLWLKIPPAVNKKFLPLLNLVPKTVLVIAFRIVLTLVFKIGWFGCQVAVYGNKQHKSALFGCSRIQKLKFDCFLHKLLICSTENGNLLNFVCFGDLIIYQDFRDLNIIHPFLGLKSQIMMLSQQYGKQDFFGHCSCTQVFHEKFRRKPKIFLTVIQRF